MQLANYRQLALAAAIAGLSVNASALDWGGSGISGLVQNGASGVASSSQGSPIFGAGGTSSPGAYMGVSAASKTGLNQPTPTGENKGDCDDLAQRIAQSKQTALEQRMPVQTPAQAMTDNGVFDTLKKKVSYLGDLIGGVFDGFSSGSFSGLSDSMMNAGAQIAYNTIGINPVNGRINYNTVIRAASPQLAGQINNGVKGLGNIGSAVGGGTIGNVIDNTVGSALGNAASDVIKQGANGQLPIGSGAQQGQQPPQQGTAGLW